MDYQWWRVHGTQVATDFRGERVSSNPVASLAVTPVNKQAVPTFGNSGAAAVSLAAHAGARRVLLLGYDCQRTGGMVHWHGNHPKTLGNAGAMPRWPKQFADLAKAMAERGVEVINCSRETALTCFERTTLELALGMEEQ
jgi:hypothetical protein